MSGHEKFIFNQPLMLLCLNLSADYFAHLQSIDPKKIVTLYRDVFLKGNTSDLNMGKDINI